MTVTCGMLAEMIEAVTSVPHGDPANESAICEFSDSDMTLIEWLCRLVPRSTVDTLKAHDQSPLWGDGAPEPADIAAPDVSQSDIDTLQSILSETQSASSDAERVRDWEEVRVQSDRSAALTRILNALRITALRSR